MQLPNPETTPRWKPSATVAAVIERDGRFLLVQEHTPEGLRFNNPAGHLEPGESLQDGCTREVLEETAYQFSPTALVGIYLNRFQRPERQGESAQDITYLRFAFCGTVPALPTQRALDHGIVRAVWMTPDEVRACAAEHRSALVMQCMQDYLSGQRYALSTLNTSSSVMRCNSE